MAIIGAWLLAIMVLEFAIGGFLLFAARGVTWIYRLVGAFFGLGCAVIFAIFAYHLATGRTEAFTPMEPKLLIFAFLFVNVFGFQLAAKFIRRPEGFGCFGTLLRLAGCALIGWAVFALVVFGIAVLIYLGS